MSLARDIKKLIRRVVKAMFADIHTHMPARIVSYNAETNTATIQPCINRFRTEDANNPGTVTLPEIEDVPVKQFGSGKLVCFVAPQEGSYGIFHIAEREIETWLTKGGVVDPQSSRKFDISDGWFDPGAYPLITDGDNGSLGSMPTDRIGFFMRDGATQISVIDNNTIYLYNTRSSIAMQSDGTVVIDGYSDAEIELASDGTVTISGTSSGVIELGSSGTVSINGNLTVDV